jgi:hypothetical protein
MRPAQGPAALQTRQLMVPPIKTSAGLPTVFLETQLPLSPKSGLAGDALYTG